MTTARVQSVMEEKIVTIEPEASLSEAARKMRQNNCGCLLVGSEENPEGIITDRDIVVRAIARDLHPSDEKIKSHMTSFVMTCSPLESVASAAEKMRQHGVGRLVVLEDGVACGVLSFGRILREQDNPQEMAEVLTQVKSA